MVKETALLEEIQRNGTKEQEVIKELKKDNKLIWEEDEIVYIKGKIYILNNRRIQEQVL